MDIIGILSSISKVALIAFILAVSAILIEIFLIFRQTKKKPSLAIPEFESGVNATPLTPEIIAKIDRQSFVFKGNPMQIKILIALLAILLLSGVFFGIYQLLSRTGKLLKPVDQSTKEQTAAVLLESAGIEIFDTNWQLIKKENYAKMSPGDIIYIGLYTINKADIANARIRINETQWISDHETVNFNSQVNVYYRQYLIGVFDNKLTIDGELFSTQQGWLYPENLEINAKFKYRRKTYNKVVVINPDKAVDMPSVPITPFADQVTPEFSPTPDLTITPTVNPSVTIGLTSQPSIPITVPVSIAVSLTPTPTQTTPPKSGFIKPSLVILFIAVVFVIVGFVL